ncbi:MAG: PAS domain S-box protein, partial [Clostridiaceae bacterium]|nr:PAS domain S-box protein [Clostridiaceae bacterium]
MVPKSKKRKTSFKQLGLAGKLTGMVILIAVIVYIPSIVFGAFSNLKNKNAELSDYKKGVEMRVQYAFEPAIWNYDIETLRKLITLELQNNNLESIRVSTEDRSLIWLSTKKDRIVDETITPEGKYIEKKTIPVYRMDEQERVIAFASIWYDHSFTRSQFLKDLLNDLLIVGIILTTITVTMTILSYVRLVRPLEVIRSSMIEAGKSAMDLAKKKIGKARFRRAFPEIKSMAADLEYMFKDIDDANQKIRENEAQFRAFFNQAGVGVAQSAVNSGRIEIVNQRYCDITGYSVEELMNMSFSDITHQVDIPKQIMLTEQIMRGEIDEFILEKRYIHKEGRHVWVQVTVSRLWEQGEPPTHLIAVTQDITARKIAEEKLNQLKNELEDKVAERTQDLESANCELEAAIDDLRTAQTQLINTEKMAVLGQLVAGIAHEINTPLGIINSAGGTIDRILQNELDSVIDFCCKVPREAYEIYSNLVQQSNNNDGIHDNTHKRMLRKMYYKTAEENGLKVDDEIIEKLVDLGYERESDDFVELVGKMDNIEAVKSAYSVAVLHKSVGMIRSSAEKASKVILALKTYSHKDNSNAPVQYDVVKDLEMVMTLYYNQMKYGIEIIREYEEVPPVICFPDKLHQIWVNIINNALQAMNYKGTLRIGISNDHDKVKISISNNGPSIPASILNRIFEPFFTTKKLGEGTGLGLDIVKRIVEEIDGKINVETKPD